MKRDLIEAFDGVISDGELIVSVSAQLKARQGNRKLENENLLKLIRISGNQMETIGESVDFINEYLDVTIETSKQVQSKLEKDEYDLTNENLVDAINTTIDTFNLINITFSDFISTIFDKRTTDTPPAIKELQKKEARLVGELYETITSGDIMGYFNLIPKDVPNSVLSDVFSTMATSVLGKTVKPLSAFKGNPLYHIGKWLNRREVKRREVIKSRIEYLRLELLELELKDGGKGNAEYKKYYKDTIRKLERKLTRD